MTAAPASLKTSTWESIPPDHKIAPMIARWWWGGTPLRDFKYQIYGTGRVAISDWEPLVLTSYYSRV